MARNPGGKRSREETTATASDLSSDETAEDVIAEQAKDHLQEEDLSLKDDLFVVQLFVADSVFRRVEKLVDVSDPHNNKRMAAVEPMLEDRRSSDGSGEVLGKGGFGLVKRGRVDGQEVAVKKSEKLTHNEIVKGGFLKMWTQEISGNVIMMGSDHSVEFHGWFMELSLVKVTSEEAGLLPASATVIEGNDKVLQRITIKIADLGFASCELWKGAILFMFEAPCYEHAIANDKQRMAMLGDLFTDLCDPVKSPADRLTATQVIAHLEFIAAEYDDADVSQQDIAVFHEEEEQEATSAPGAPVLVVSRLGELQAQDVDRDQGADVDEMAAQAAQADLAAAVQEAMTAPGAQVLVVSRLGELQAQDVDRDQGADVDEMAAQAAQADLAAAVQEAMTAPGAQVLVVSRLGELQAQDVDRDQGADVDEMAAQAAQADLAAAVQEAMTAPGAPVLVVSRLGELQAQDVDRDQGADVDEIAAQAALAAQEARAAQEAQEARAAQEAQAALAVAVEEPVLVVSRLGELQAPDVDWDQVAPADDKAAQAAFATAAEECSTSAGGAPVCVVTRRIGKLQAGDSDRDQVAAAGEKGAQAALATAAEECSTSAGGAPVCVVTRRLGKFQARDVDWGQVAAGDDMTAAQAAIAAVVEGSRLLQELQWKFQARDVDWGQVAAAVDMTGAQAATAAAVEGDTTTPAQVLVIAGPEKLQAGNVGRDPIGVRMKRRLKKLLRKPQLLQELQGLWPSWLTPRGLLS
eukprot:gene22204-29267_t